MRHSERTAACLSHLAGIVPIWGALVMAAVFWRFRGRARPVVFHAQQGLFFHCAVLVLATVPLLGIAVGNMIAVLRPAQGALVAQVGYYLLAAIGIANAVVAAWAANTVIDGREFNYPFFGKRLRPSFEEPPVVRQQREFHTYLTPNPPADTPVPAAPVQATTPAPAPVIRNTPPALPVVEPENPPPPKSTPPPVAPTKQG